MHSDGGRAAVFAALDTGRRADAVVRRLADGIALGILAPDEQLPSETELADTFGVSPVTIASSVAPSWTALSVCAFDVTAGSVTFVVSPGTPHSPRCRTRPSFVRSVSTQ